MGHQFRVDNMVKINNTASTASTANSLSLSYNTYISVRQLLLVPGNSLGQVFADSLVLPYCGRSPDRPHREQSSTFLIAPVRVVSCFPRHNLSQNVYYKRFSERASIMRMLEIVYPCGCCWSLSFTDNSLMSFTVSTPTRNKIYVGFLYKNSSWEDIAGQSESPRNNPLPAARPAFSRVAATT